LPAFLPALEIPERKIGETKNSHPRHQTGIKRKMGLVAKEMFMLFPTGFFTGKLPDVALCDRVEKKLRDMQKSGQGYFAKHICGHI
jgi:hypothetical protein